MIWNYGYKEDGTICHLNNALSYEDYYIYDDKGNKHKLINKFNGSIKKRHWSISSNISNESIIHINGKMHFIKYKTLNLFNIKITAERVLIERDAQKFLNTKKIPDVLFLDKYNNPICIIEVCVTNAKKEDDINYYNSKGLTVIEVYYDKNTTDYNWYRSYLLSFKDESKQRRFRELRNIKEQIENIESEIRFEENRIKQFRTIIERGY